MAAARRAAGAHVGEVHLQLDTALLDNGNAVFAQVLANTVCRRQLLQLLERPHRQFFLQLLHKLFEIAEAPADRPLQAPARHAYDVDGVPDMSVTNTQ